MRPRAHEEIVKYGKGFIEVCEMEIEAIELRMEYYYLMADETNKFDGEIFDAIEERIAVDAELDEEGYSSEYNIPLESVFKMVEVAKGLKRSRNLNHLATRYKMSLMDERAVLDYAYQKGFAIGMIKAGGTIEEVTERTGLSVEEVKLAIEEDMDDR